MSTEEIKKENITMHRVISRAVINLKKLKNDLSESKNLQMKQEIEISQMKRICEDNKQSLQSYKVKFDTLKKK